MLVSIIIIELIINLKYHDITILVQLKTVFQNRKFIRRAVWWTWKMYINSHKKHLHENLALIALLIICCIFTYWSIFYLLYI